MNCCPDDLSTGRILAKAAESASTGTDTDAGAVDGDGKFFFFLVLSCVVTLIKIDVDLHVFGGIVRMFLVFHTCSDIVVEAGLDSFLRFLIGGLFCGTGALL